MFLKPSNYLSDCACVNGGICERNGRCLCPVDFEGRRCENRKGCSPPSPPVPPLQVVLSPPDWPVTAVYTCPTEYELRGPSVLTCMSNTKWSSKPPVCREFKIFELFHLERLPGL
ncbi:hypothetical protein AVEN_146047-1 [Araneus ventricosus]|uniref:Sushi domain-containing protein n=1 Tax=Araneus ventricosus TaxID=182803 RepID=A0A4Y2PUN3_ARAVE|nr:hypothetical protein AVEN_253894-1 [Araneus ventricosus]GBN54007.1 hypothetical protein AVEN_37152-1 [Araneus ventricosus]GBN54014.1 hypothetical protein AVEN_65476-1 [Araneus ventricosus]GBN54054.1 hypothetical protein AVEN_146047-1 [Araneus ventricosus]